MAKKKAVKKKARKAVPPPKKAPRQKALPGMEDRAIAALDEKAQEYADARDTRMEYGKQEAELKKDLLTMMKAKKKSHYKHGTVEIEIIPEKEKVRVTIKPENEEKPDDTGNEAAQEAAGEGEDAPVDPVEDGPEPPEAGDDEPEPGETEEDEEEDDFS